MTTVIISSYENPQDCPAITSGYPDPPRLAHWAGGAERPRRFWRGAGPEVDVAPEVGSRAGVEQHPRTQAAPDQAGDLRPIVVGVDGSPQSRAALEWAVIRATASHNSLHLVHAFRWSMLIDPCGVVVWLDPGVPEAAQSILDAAAVHANTHAPWLSISTRLLIMSPAAALLREGRGAELIVLGPSHPRKLLGFVRPTVNSRVIRRAPGRVVIVGPDTEELH